MRTEELAAAAVSMRPFVPSRNFDESRRFYEALGFEITPLGDKAAHAQLGSGRGSFSFILQDFYVKEFAENFMMHLMVTDLDGWWRHIASLPLVERFRVPAPRRPEMQSWGLRVGYVWDPAGVLWHIASET